MQGMRIRFGDRSYPTIYHNDQGLFPQQPDGFYYELVELPLCSSWELFFFRDGLIRGHLHTAR
jgi:hypothetical protein